MSNSGKIVISALLIVTVLVLIVVTGVLRNISFDSPGFVAFVIVLDGVVWGFVTRAIVKGKGYESYNSWFWCGFFLALIGVIVAACKPAVNTTQSYAPVPVQPQASDADELKKYKELLDSGAITQEEYDAKKKQLLHI